MKCPKCNTEMEEGHDYEPNLPLGVALGNISLGLCFDTGKDYYECPKCGHKEEE